MIMIECSKGSTAARHAPCVQAKAGKRIREVSVCQRKQQRERSDTQTDDTGNYKERGFRGDFSGLFPGVTANTLRLHRTTASLCWWWVALPWCAGHNDFLERIGTLATHKWRLQHECVRNQFCLFIMIKTFNLTVWFVYLFEQWYQGAPIAAQTLGSKDL